MKSLLVSQRFWIIVVCIGLECAVMNAQDHFDKGLECYKAYNLACAKENFQKTIAAEPNNEEALRRLGGIAIDQKDWEVAIEMYRRALEINPDNADNYFKYGGAFGLKALNIGRINAFFLIDDVRDNFLKAAEMDSRHLESRWGLVEFYVQLPAIIGGGLTKASKYAEELFTISKVDGNMAKGYIALEDKEKELAASFYRQSVFDGIKLHKYDLDKAGGYQITESNYAFSRNQLHYQIGKACYQYDLELEKGIAHLNYFLDHYGVEDHITKDWGYYFLAKIYQRQQKLEESKEMVDIALKLRPTFKEALELKATL